MARKIVSNGPQVQATFITGPAGCSKSTLAGLAGYLSKGPIMHVDSSSLLERSRARMTPAGIMLKKMSEMQANGVVLPGEPVVHSVLENLQYLQKVYPQVRHFVVAGCPRSEEEIRSWLKVRHEGLISFKTFFIECSDEEIEQGVQNRIRKGELRLDNDPQVVATRITEYHQKTLPAVRKYARELHLATTHRNHILEKRLDDLLNHLNVPERVSKKLIGLLRTRDHPIHAKIAEIDGRQAPSRRNFNRHVNDLSVVSRMPQMACV